MSNSKTYYGSLLATITIYKYLYLKLNVLLILFFRNMDLSLTIISIVLLFSYCNGLDPDQDQDAEVEARTYLEYLNKEMAIRGNEVAKAEWDYATHLTDSSLQNKVTVIK